MRSSPVYTDISSSAEARLPVVRREDLLNEISIYHGAVYRPGGENIVGVDCSGLVQSVYASVGVMLPRTVVEQYARGIPVSPKATKTGDLVFFGQPGHPTHVGVAISDREIVHASSSRGVVVDDIKALAGSMKLAGIRRVARLK
jgi:cell wall-associated NlpC family hydrolase